MILKKSRKIFIRALLVLILFGGIMILLDLLIHYPPFQRYLIQQISETAQYEIQTGKIRIGFRGGIGIHVTKLTARSRTSALEISTGNVDISFEYRELINGRLVPARAFIKDARILVKPREIIPPPTAVATDRPLGLEHNKGLEDKIGVKRIIGALFSGFKWVKLENATLIVMGSDYRVTHLNAIVQETDKDLDGRRINLTGQLEMANTSTPFRLKGEISRAPDDDDRFFTQSTLTVSDFPLTRLPWPMEVPFKTGRATGRLDITGTIGANMAVTGQFTADDLHFSVVKHGQTKIYHIKQADVNATGQVSLKSFQIEKLTFRLPDAGILLAIQLDWHEPSIPKMDLDIRTQPMPLAVFKRIFPTPLVPKWIKDRLFPLFSGGTARLDRFRLNGAINQIKMLNRPGNADVLELRLTLEGLTALTKTPGLPVTHVGGNVVINNGRLLVTDVNGHFGQSDIHRGTMSWPDLYGKSDAFDIGIQGNFDLADLKRQSKQPLLPDIIRREMDRVSAAQGRLTADIGLFFPSPRHPPSVKGSLAMKESQVTHTALPLPLALASTRIDFDGNKPIQMNGNGRWGQSDFSIAGIFSPPWLAKNSDDLSAINLDIHTAADLSDLLAIRKWQALPSEWRAAFAGIQTVTGRIDANFNIHRTPSKSSKTKVIGDFKTSHIMLTHTNLKLPLDIQEARLEIADSGTGQFTANGQWGKSFFSADGHIVSLGKTVEINVSTQADANEIINTIARKHTQATFNKPLPSQLRIRKAAAQWTFNGKINLDGVEIHHPDFVLSPPGKNNQLAFTLGYAPSRGVTLEQCHLIQAKSQLTVKGAWASHPKGLLSFDMSTHLFHLADLGLKIMGNDTHTIMGTVSGHLAGSLLIHQPDATRINGNLTVNNLRLSKTSTAASYNADLRFKDQHIDITSLSFPMGAGRAILRGQLTTGDKWQGRLSLNTDTLDIPLLIRQFRNAQSPGAGDSITNRHQGLSIPGPLSTSHLDIAVTARETTWEGVGLGSLQATIRYQDQGVSISKAVLTTSDSLIKLSGTVTDKQHSGISLLTYIKINQKPLSALLNGLDIHTDRIKGTISLEGGMFFSGKTKTEIIQNLTGKFNLELTEGEVKKSNILLKVMDFLSIQNIFLRRPPNILKERFYFKSIQGHIKVEKGILTADRLFMKSPIFNAAAKGSLDLPKNHLKIALGVQPLNTIDFIVSKIPIVGHILAGKEKTILIYYFKIRGPLENPTVKHVPFNNLGNALTGYFKRLFLTPVRLLFKISDTLDDLGKELQSGTNPPVSVDER